MPEGAWAQHRARLSSRAGLAALHHHILSPTVKRKEQAVPQGGAREPQAAPWAAGDLHCPLPERGTGCI